MSIVAQVRNVVHGPLVYLCFNSFQVVDCYLAINNCFNSLSFIFGKDKINSTGTGTRCPQKILKIKQKDLLCLEVLVSVKLNAK